MMDHLLGISRSAIKRTNNIICLFWSCNMQSKVLMYHPHHDSMTQMGLGLMGMLIVHPRDPAAIPRVDRDFVLLLSECFIKPGTDRPDPNVMDDFNVLAINARSFHGTSPLIAQKVLK